MTHRAPTHHTSSSSSLDQCDSHFSCKFTRDVPACSHEHPHLSRTTSPPFQSASRAGRRGLCDLTRDVHACSQEHPHLSHLQARSLRAPTSTHTSPSCPPSQSPLRLVDAAPVKIKRDVPACSQEHPHLSHATSLPPQPDFRAGRHGLCDTLATSLRVPKKAHTSRTSARDVTARSHERPHLSHPPQIATSLRATKAPTPLAPWSLTLACPVAGATHSRPPPRPHATPRPLCSRRLRRALRHRRRDSQDARAHGPRISIVATSAAVADRGTATVARARVRARA